MTRPPALADIEAVLWRRFRPVSAEDVNTLRSMVTAYAEAEGLALARQRVLERRRAALMSASGPPGAPLDPALRGAHAEVVRLREQDLPVPVRLADPDRQYERDRKRAQRAGRRAA